MMYPAQEKFSFDINQMKLTARQVQDSFRIFMG